MRFKSKDLMVSISPNVEIDREAAAELCLGGTRICIHPTFDPCHGFTRFCHWPSRCFGHSIVGCDPCSFRPTWHCGFLTCGGSACDPTFIPCGFSVFEIEDPQDLVQVREELQGLLKEVDALEEKGLPSRFRNVEEAEEAEEALQQALKEIRRQKKNL